jgi:RNA recognition motif-containing protein
VKGLAYVDFSDDAHLALAVAKNKQMLLGKRLTIARSNPNKSRKDSSGRDNQMEHGRLMYLYCLFAMCACQGKHACVCAP